MTLPVILLVLYVVIVVILIIIKFVYWITMKDTKKDTKSKKQIQQTVFQLLYEKLERVGDEQFLKYVKLNKSGILDKEKEQIIEAFDIGCQDENRIGEEFYNETYNK